MAQINFEEVSFQSNNNNNNNANSVGFFALKNDGDTALVRILHDSTADFDILTVHDIKYNGKSRKVSCVRNPKDPLDACPLCKNGSKDVPKLFIHMLVYTTDSNGQVVAEAKVWERTMKYATTLKNLINNYGPLSDNLFLVTRNGAAGDVNTTYDINYASPARYPNENYPKETKAFDNYNVLGSIVLDKTAAEIQYFINTGEFPAVEKAATTAPAPQPAPIPQVAPAPTFNPAAYDAAPSFAPAGTAPVDAPAMDRPVRYY